MSKPETMMIDNVKYIREDSISQKADILPDNTEFCIIRTYSAGVHAGYINRDCDKKATVYKSYRVWYWDGAASLSQLAVDGSSAPENCKISIQVPEIDLKEIIEVIPCTKKSKSFFEDVNKWKK